MINGIVYKAKEIAKIVNGILSGEDVKIESVTIDSKIVYSSACFFAIKGKHFNGVDYINEAISNGAVLIITDEKIRADVSVIYVNSVVEALGLLAKHHKGNTKIIGVTGSVGKTTTKDMILQVIGEKYSVCGTYKNQNNEIGVALTLLSIKKEEFCVVEMGMRAIGEIEWLSFISEPHIAIITNCGSAHLGRLGSRENIFKAKTEILRNTQKYAVLPAEKRFAEINTELEKVLVGVGGNVYEEKIKVSNNYIEFDINYGEGVCKNVRLNSRCSYNISNALNAFAVCKLLGMDDETIRNGIEKYRDSNLHGEIIKIKKAEIVVDCYNASFEGMESAIKAFAEYSKINNKMSVVILGDMLELGESSEEFHRKIGELCQQNKISALFCFGEFARCYAEGFSKGIIFDSKEEIADVMQKVVNFDCVVLVKASRKCQFEKIIEILRMRE